MIVKYLKLLAKAKITSNVHFSKNIVYFYECPFEFCPRGIYRDNNVILLEIKIIILNIIHTNFYISIKFCAIQILQLVMFVALLLTVL